MKNILNNLLFKVACGIAFGILLGYYAASLCYGFGHPIVGGYHTSNLAAGTEVGYRTAPNLLINKFAN